MGQELVIDFINELIKDNSMPKNIRSELREIKNSLNCEKTELALSVNAALQKLEEISNDPNISTFGRTEIWNLTSAIEELNK